MGAASRNKGKAAERELATMLSAITGYDVRRRVRQHDGDDDLVGIPGWSIEVKRYATAPLARVCGEWWPQAVQQARASGDVPVLFYRADRQPWRAVWPADVFTDAATVSMDYRDTLNATPETWWRLVAAFSRNRKTEKQS